MQRLQHFLPDVGAIEAEFFDESEVLYNFLQSRGEIRRAQQLAQLGLVQHAWPLARHTRWDFTMLLLDLVRRTKVLPGIHIGSRVRLSPSLTITSARELLNCWALLLNIGHLHGTFATETELLFELKRKATGRSHIETLLSTVPPGGAREWATAVLNDERTYQFYQLLAFYRLDRLAGGQPYLGVWKTMLAQYVTSRAEESPALTKTRDLFRRIRRLAFLTLDASLTPTPVEVRLAQLASTPDALERLLAPPPWAASEDELASLEEFLSREIYNGREVLVALAEARPNMRRRLRASLSRSGLRYTVESAAKTDHHSPAPQHGPSGTRDVVRGVVGDPLLRALARGGRIGIPRRRYEDSFERWAGILGARASLQIVQNASGSQLVLQTNVHRDRRVDYACAITGALLLTERLRNSLVKGSPIPGLDQYMFRSASKGIIDAALGHFFPNAAHWEWSAPIESHLSLFGKKAVVLPMLKSAADTPQLSRARQHELSALTERVANVRAQLVAVAIANLTAYAPDQITHLGELDGVVVGVDLRRSDLVLAVIEAKYTKGAEASARTQLQKTLNGLGTRTQLRRGPLSSKAAGRRGQAWVYIRSGYAERR